MPDVLIRERPILFSGPMIRAILDGKKTQTRRIVKSTRNNADGIAVVETCEGTWPYHLYGDLVTDENGCDHIVKCPYGMPGERLWVRETWLPLDRDHWIGSQRYAYAADITADGDEIRKEYLRLGRPYRWRPSIHMPRAASRITLEVTDIRVERLHEISEEDAIAEGCQCTGAPAALTNRGEFAKLWELINGEESWKSNPWVWVVSFKRMELANR